MPPILPIDGPRLLRYRQGVGRVGIMLCVALPLAAADLLVKAHAPTEPWAYHERSLGWLALSVSLLAGMVVVARIPSALVAPAAGVARRWRARQQPVRCLERHGGAEPADSSAATTRSIAFNLADVWALTGILLLVCTLGVWLIRNRDLIPPPEEVRSTRGRAFKRLFEDDRP